MTRPLSFDRDAAASLEQLAAEAPVLARLRRFALGLDRVDWLSHLGDKPTPAVRSAARAYLDTLGFPQAELAVLPGFEDALGVAETSDWASPAWEAEELLRADLTATALALVSEEALELGLRLAAQYAAEAGMAAAEQQIALFDAEDEGALNVLVGAVAHAVHGAGLLLIAAAADQEIDVNAHAFAHRYRLYQLGRWPVAIIGDTFSLF